MHSANEDRHCGKAKERRLDNFEIIGRLIRQETARLEEVDLEAMTTNCLSLHLATLKSRFEDIYFQNLRRSPSQTIVYEDIGEKSEAIRKSLSDFGNTQFAASTSTLSFVGNLELQSFRTNDSPIRIQSEDFAPESSHSAAVTLQRDEHRSTAADNIPDSVFLSIDLESKVL